MSAAAAAIPCCASICCLGSALAVTLVLAVNYNSLLGQAEDYNAANPLTTYDDCGGAYGADAINNSGWTMIYKFNFIIYTIMASLAGSALLCVPCAPAAICPAFCFACAGMPTFVAMILTGIRLNNNNGDICAANEAAYATLDGEDLTFAGDAEFMRKLWITQISMHIPLICFMTCGVQMAFMGLAMYTGSGDSSIKWEFNRQY